MEICLWDDSISLKKHNCKTKHILIIVIIAVSIIALIVLYPALLLGGFFDNPPDKDH